MNYLLDVNVLFAAAWEDHAHHAKVWHWLAGKSVSVCPLSELGFIRLSTHPKVAHLPMPQARMALENFLDERGAGWIADDLRALESAPKKSNEVTDSYLATLAQKHGIKLATLDSGIKHPAAVLIG